MPFLTEKEANLLFKNLQKNGERKFSESKFFRKYHKKEESALVKACMQYLSLKGYLPIRNNSGLIVVGNEKRRAIKMGAAGSPDIIACVPGGRFLAIECKSGKGKLSRAQQEFLKKVESLGGIAIVIKNIDELINFLQEKHNDKVFGNITGTTGK